MRLLVQCFDMCGAIDQFNSSANMSEHDTTFAFQKIDIVPHSTNALHDNLTMPDTSNQDR